MRIIRTMCNPSDRKFKFKIGDMRRIDEDKRRERIEQERMQIQKIREENQDKNKIQMLEEALQESLTPRVLECGDGGSSISTNETTPKKNRASQPRRTIEIPAPIRCTSQDEDGYPLNAFLLHCGITPMSINETTLKKKRKPLSREAVNIGSESESDEIGDEAEVPLIIPRVLRVAMEESDDDDDDDAAEEYLLPLSSPPSPTSSASDEADTFYDFQWSPFPNPPVPADARRETFSAPTAGPTAPHASPYDAFAAIWDPRFMQHIAQQTNRYAQQHGRELMDSHALGPGSRICDWKDTSPDELYVYFAILLATGIVIKSRLMDYWNGNSDIFVTPGFQACMPLRRFQLLTRCLHFCNDEDLCSENMDVSQAKLYKIQPVIDHLNSRFQELYNLGQDIALDESLLQRKGLLSLNQSIPNKAAGVGIKSHELCEPQTGYLWRLVVHTHKSADRAATVAEPLLAATPALVLSLLQGLEHKGHTVWMDSYYNSPALARIIKSLGFDCVGTLRMNRQFVPRALKNLTKADMEPGQIKGCTSGDVDVLVWRDRRLVGAVSTYHGDATTKVKGITKPASIHEHNLMMGGVDKKDQLLAAYPIERKSARVWYKKLFRRLLNVSVLNAFILYRHNNPVSHREFRTTLIKSILKQHLVPAAAPFPQSTPKRFLAREHHLAEYEFLPKLKCRRRRRCVACGRRSTTYCVGCDKAMCLAPCFVSCH